MPPLPQRWRRAAARVQAGAPPPSGGAARRLGARLLRVKHHLGAAEKRDHLAGHLVAGLDVLNKPDDSLLITRLSEEHGVVEVQRGGTTLEPGDRVRVLPNHSCVVSNMVDTVQLVDGSTIVETLPIEARGKII